MASSRLRCTATGLLVISLAGVVCAAAAPAAHAIGTTITVSTTTDETSVNGNCSLREALQAANTDRRVDTCRAGHGTDVIVLGVNTYPIRLGTLEVHSTVFLRGTSAVDTVIDGRLTDTSRYWRVFHVNAGAALDAAAITIRRSLTNAIRNDGTLHLTSMAVRDGETTQSPDG